MAEVAFPERVQQVLSILLIVGGLAVYIGWGIANGSWNLFERRFIPIYAIVAVMFLFGGLGLLLLKNKQ